MSESNEALRIENLDITVINLERDVERLSRIEAQFSEQRLADRWKRFSAIDGSDLLDKDVKENCTDHGWRLFNEAGKIPENGSISLASLACALSWKEIISDLTVPTLVLEDDAVLCSGFVEKYHQAVSELPSNWDIVYLSWNQPEGKFKVGERISSHVRKVESRLHGTGALLIRPEVRMLLLSIFPLDLQLDHDIPDKLITKTLINAYALKYHDERLITNDNYLGSRTQL